MCMCLCVCVWFQRVAVMYLPFGPSYLMTSTCPAFTCDMWCGCVGVWCALCVGCVWVCVGVCGCVCMLCVVCVCACVYVVCGVCICCVWMWVGGWVSGSSWKEATQLCTRLAPSPERSRSTAHTGSHKIGSDSM